LGGISLNTKIEQNIIEYLLLSDNLSKIYLKNEKSVSKDSFLPKSWDMAVAYRFREFMDKILGGFFIYYADGNEDIIYVNEGVLSIFNCGTLKEFKELTGNSFRGMVHPEDIGQVEESIKEQILNSRYDLDYLEYRIIQKGGEIRWVDDYGHFVHSDAVGDIFYVFIGDSTNKKRFQIKEKITMLEDKRQKEKMFQSRLDEYSQRLEGINQEYLKCLEIIEGLSIDYESIFYADLDSNKIKAYRVSCRFEKVFPEVYMERDFVGFDSDYIDKWVYTDDREIVFNFTKPENIRERALKEKTFHINYRIYRDGKPAYIQLRIVNVSAGKHISQIIMGYRNIDNEIMQEIKQKQMLNDALNEAVISNNAKNLFLSNMSHDIRTPMNAIVNFAFLAKKYIDDKDKVSNYLDMISISSEQLLKLLNDILEISRLESGKINVEETRCNLMDIIHTIQVDKKSQAEKKNIVISLDISGLKHDDVFVDQQKLTQILSYILDNAVKYTNDDGWIIITVSEKAETQNECSTYQFIVEDNGIGIGEDFIGRIFEPFERERNTTSSGIYGAGLGLKIVKDLVYLMGGTVKVESVAGKGSKFTVSITLRIQESFYGHQSENSNDDNVVMKFSRPKKILVVDDNEINLEIENEVLKEAGFIVDTAVDGSIAVEKIKQSQPGDYDLILMDIQMPIMNGYRATKAIRKINNPKLSGIPIIAVSANTFDEDKKKSIESGMNAHLAKPLDAPLLYKLIWKFLKDD